MTEGLSLLQPIWLLLLPFPALWLMWRRRNPAAWPTLPTVPRIRFPGTSRLRADLDLDTPASNSRSRHWPDTLTALGLMAMTIALAQPIMKGPTITAQQQSEPVELVLVVDTAVSMALKDYQVSGQWLDRMAVTRALLQDFIRGYSGAGMALVIMGSPPVVWLPLTSDKQVVNHAVQRLRPALGGRLGQMGDTLELVARQFANPADGTKERVVVLISDAGLQSGRTSPEDGARSLRNAGLHLYTIVVGSPSSQAERSESGLLHSPADAALMARLATIGNGRSYRAGTAESFRDALVDIETSHRQAVPPPVETHLQRPIYPYLLSLSLALILTALIVAQGASLPAKALDS